jgi:hypothetical protein
VARIVQHKIEIAEPVPLEALEIAEGKDRRDARRQFATRIFKTVTSLSELDYAARRANVRYQLIEARRVRVRVALLGDQAA